MTEKKEVIEFASEKNAIIENSAIELIIEQEIDYKKVIEESIKKEVFVITKKMIEEKIVLESTKMPKQKEEEKIKKIWQKL